MRRRPATSSTSTVGDLPSRAFAFRFNREGSNMEVTGIELFNNIWSDPTGTMGAIDSSDGNDFSDASDANVGTFMIDHNLYWNGGDAIPEDPAEAINPSDDVGAIMGDPGLGAQSGLVAPHWDGAAFADGSNDICEAFERVVTMYGTPAAGTSGVDTADPSRMAADDIMGRPRSGAPDVGAVERP